MAQISLRHIYIISLLLFLFVISLSAQESTESPVPPTETLSPSPTIEPTFTPIPTETPTELPTTTDLPTATATETEAATETATDSPLPSETATQAEFTPEVTEVIASATASETASATASSTNAVTVTNTETAAINASTNTDFLTISEFGYREISDLNSTSSAVWTLIDHNNEIWLASPPNQALEATLGTGFNIGVSLDFALATGSFSLDLRKSSIGSYRLAVDSLGNLSLWRDTQLLSSNIVQPLGNNTHTLHFQANEGQLLVEFDGNLVLAYNDLQALPSGEVRFNTSNSFYLREASLLMARPEWNLYLSNLPRHINTQENSDNQTNNRTLEQVSPSIQSVEDFDSVLYSAYNGGSNDIFKVDVSVCSGGCSPQIFYNPLGSLSMPVWSPDRSQVLYVYSEPNNPGAKHLYIADAANPADNHLLTSPTIQNISGVSWSRLTNQIAFSGIDYSVAGGRDIFIIDLDSCGTSFPCAVTNITNTSDIKDYYPDFSPDGTQLVFASDDENYQTDLYVMNVNGTNKTNLTNDEVTEGDPDWSPDGSQIVYNTGNLREIRLYSFSMNSSTTLITTNTSNEQLYPPSWSPNGSEFVYGYFSIVSGLYVFNLSDHLSRQIISMDYVGASDWGYAAPDPNYCPIPDSFMQESIVWQQSETPRCQNEAELLEYGVIAEGPWTDDDIAVMLQGVRNAALALTAFSGRYGAGQETEAFRAIMLLSDTHLIKFEKLNNSDQFCTTYKKLLTDGQTAVIQCGGRNSFTEYTAVHELGHVFIYLTGVAEPFDQGVIPCANNTGVTFLACLENPVAGDSSTSLGFGRTFIFGLRTERFTQNEVSTWLGRMGYDDNLGINAATDFIYQVQSTPTPDPNNPNPTPEPPRASLTDWKRGDAGWGSSGQAPQSFVCEQANDQTATPPPFQQNACYITDWVVVRASITDPADIVFPYSGSVLATMSEETATRLQITEKEEAGADMFLNWVYHTLELGGFDDNSKITGLSSSQSGAADDRLFWFEANLQLFFDYYGW